jgi:hypothetical protein
MLFGVMVGWRVRTGACYKNKDNNKTLGNVTFTLCPSAGYLLCALFGSEAKKVYFICRDLGGWWKKGWRYGLNIRKRV